MAQLEYGSAWRSRRKAGQHVSMKPLNQADRRTRGSDSVEESGGWMGLIRDALEKVGGPNGI